MLGVAHWFLDRECTAVNEGNVLIGMFFMFQGRDFTFLISWE